EARVPCLTRARRPIDPLPVRVVRADEVADRVAAELVAGGGGELPRDACLGDDGEGLDGGRGAALDQRLAGLARLQVDRRKRAHQRRQRLHRRPNDDLLPVRGAALDPAGVIRLAVEAALVAPDLVVRGRPAQLRERKAFADLDTLDRLSAHQRRGEPRVEAVLLRRVRAEARWYGTGTHLDDAADG